MYGTVSPGSKAGRGLKHQQLMGAVMRVLVSPGSKAGRGLKQAQHQIALGGRGVSPGSKAGRGLKLQGRAARHAARAEFRPAQKPGAD